MMGLLALLFFATYFAVSLWVIFAVLKWAQKNKRSGWWGILAAFVMYNLVFWDWIPTVLVHKYYCATQAGFWVYKTPEEWRSENANLTFEDLQTYGKKNYMGKMIWTFPYKESEKDPKRRATMINKRIYIESNLENVLGIIPITKHVTFITDTKNNEKLAQQITFGSGYQNPMTTGGIAGFKKWLANSACNDNVGIHTAEYDNFIEKIISLGDKNDRIINRVTLD